MISVKSLRFSYTEKDSASDEALTLKGLNFGVESGEIFGFLGPSGSGKSTTQKILTGLLSGYQGEVLVDGKELSQWGNDYYYKIGVGFELPNHFNKLTALENLNLFASFYNQKTKSPEELLERLGLLNDADKRVEDFSKGMKMRLNFARAILHEPQLIFLDEPTAGLDPVNSRILRSIISELRSQGCTFFLTTHNMLDTEKLCDRIAFIVDGKIVDVGRPQQMKLEHGKHKVLVEHELNGIITSDLFEFDHLGENKAFLEILNGDNVRSIHSQEASIEDVFVEKTGVRLV